LMSVNRTWSVLREPMYTSVPGGKPALADRRLASSEHLVRTRPARPYDPPLSISLP
jgi:hypothetical protein